MSIKIQVTAVNSIGAKYEMVQFKKIELQEEKSENAPLQDIEGVSLMMNQPSLSGTFKPGDIVELRVVKHKDV